MLLSSLFITEFIAEGLMTFMRSPVIIFEVLLRLMLKAVPKMSLLILIPSFRPFFFHGSRKVARSGNRASLWSHVMSPKCPWQMTSPSNRVLLMLRRLHHHRPHHPERRWTLLRCWGALRMYEMLIELIVFVLVFA